MDFVVPTRRRNVARSRQSSESRKDTAENSMCFSAVTVSRESTSNVSSRLLRDQARQRRYSPGVRYTEHRGGQVHLHSRM